jgi:hypothetical protein
MPYPTIPIRFSKSQSPAQRGKRVKTAQFEGYVDTRPIDINSEIYDIDVKTPYLKLNEAVWLESLLDEADGSPFYLQNNGRNLGLFRLSPNNWTVDEKPTLTSWVRSLQFKVVRAFGLEE